MTLLDRLRCAVLGELCRPPWKAEDDANLLELRWRTEAANRRADELRERRLTWDRVYGLDGRDREGDGDAGRG